MSSVLFTPITTKPAVTPPRGWRWAKLTEVARLESGHTPSRRQPAYWENGTVPWLSLGDIRHLDGKYIVDTADHPTPLGIENSSARVLPKNTVALCRTASVGKAVILGTDMATSQDFVNWVCGSQLYHEYLYWAIRSSSLFFDNEKQGSTHKTIYMPTLEAFNVLLPPLPEQKRIAAILDKADAIKRKRQEAIRLTEELLRAAFLEMFGDPVTNPKGWPVRKLGELGQVSTGATPPGGESNMFGGNVPFITPADLDSRDAPKRYLTEQGARSVRLVREGAALVCCIGATIGKMSVAKAESAFNQQLNAVEWTGACMDTYGIEALRLLRPVIVASAKSTTLPILKKSAFCELSLPVAPLGQRTRFERLAKTIDGMSTKLLTDTAPTDLARSLATMAFSGRL